MADGETCSSGARTRTGAVALAGIATALPPFRIDQRDALRRVAAILDDAATAAWLERVGAKAGVETRYAVCAPTWFETPRGWSERTERYVDGAGALFVTAARRALAAAGWRGDDVDVVVTVSSTGVATPTLEARAHGTLGLRGDVRRVPVFGLGCAGGVTGLALARRLAAAEPGRRVLLVCVETCTLSFQSVRPRRADLVAAVLFGDGAAACCLVADGVASAPVRLGDGVERLWPETLAVMGWDVRDDGLGVVFDRDIPSFVEAHLGEAVTTALAGGGVDAVARYVCHPGGPKVLDALARILELPPDRLAHERAVLRACGNMSAPTVLFVLERVLGAPTPGVHLLLALGPGFTASLLPLTVEAR